MAGIYIHIPYCKQACHYCNFHFSTTLKSRDAMVAAILDEIELRKDYLDEAIETIYFGGGTPSLLSGNQIDLILEKVLATFEANNVKEITLEANPEDISSDKIRQWQNLGVNRISLGVQSFDDHVLSSLNRSHSGNEAHSSIETILEGGIENLTIDLIYGLPEQSLEQWQINLNKVLGYQIPHVSAYALTIEPGTVFGHLAKQGSIKDLEDSVYEQQYALMCESLGANGFEHYEVSNFARTGYRSAHNQLYWQGVPYLGLGPGAHSFNGEDRQFNVSNNARYIRSIGENNLPVEIERLSSEEKFNEYLLTGLRTSSGIDFGEIAEKFDIDLLTTHKSYLDRCVENNLAYFNKKKFTLTEKGFFLSDGVILKLMK